MKLIKKNNFINRFCSTLFELKNIKNEEIRRRAYILNIILCGFLILSTYSWVSWIFNFINETKHSGLVLNQLINATLFLLLPIALLRLSAKGRPKTASLILITLLFLAVFQISYVHGINVPTAILTYTLIILISGILIGPIDAIIWTIIISITGIVLFYLQSHQIIPVDYSWKTEESEWIDVLVLIFLYLVIAIVSWLSSKEINKSLIRARRSEQIAIKYARKLEKQNVNLEKLVLERTREIRENQLKQLTEISSLAEYGKLTGGVLHDISNPLTIISMNLDSIQESVKASSIFKKINLENLIKKSLIAMNMVESVIKTSKRQLSKEEIEEYFDIKKELSNTLMLVKSRANKLGIKISCECKKNIKILGYPIKLSRVVANLVMNSIDALREVQHEDKKIEVIIKRNKNIVEIKVIDNGIGIKDDDKKKIFQPSFSARPSEDRMGLGLPISQEIIKNYFNGNIKFKSQYLKGSEFIINFPIKTKNETKD